MYKCVLYTTLVVFVVYECETAKESSPTKNGHIIDFWVRDNRYEIRRNEKHENITKNNKFKKNNSKRRYHIPRHELQKILGPHYNLDGATDAIDAFFNNLDEDKKVQHPALKKLLSIISNDARASLYEKLVEVTSDVSEEQSSVLNSTDKPAGNYRRHGKLHSHGPHHRVKPSSTPMNSRLVSDEHIQQQNKEYDVSNETRKFPKPWSVIRQRMQLAQAYDQKTPAYEPVTKAETIELSPYSLKQQLEKYMLKNFSNVNITMEVLGRTVEYNDIVLLKCTSTKNKFFRAANTKFVEEPEQKKVIFIVHGLTVMGYNQLPCMRSLGSFLKLVGFYFDHLDKFDIFLIPMANPDGVAAATAKLFWNKNMSPQDACPGVALDRNFDVAWNESHAKASSCSPQFPGGSPFSELETQVIRDMFHKYSHRIIGYFHVHAGSYGASIFKGDAVLYPKGYSEFATDDDKYIDIRADIEESMKNASFKVFSVTVDTLHNWYGKVAGTSVDYASTVYGIQFAMELVMQLYQDNLMVDESKERETSSVLTEVWQRVLNVIFQNMYNFLQKSEL